MSGDGVSSADGERPDGERPLSGVDLARAALAKARQDAREAAARRGSAMPNRGPGGSARAGSRAVPPRDPSEPERLGAAVQRLIVERGWEIPTAAAGVSARWEEIAGPELAGHCRPERFAEGVLTLVAESTAWATQVRLLRASLHRRISEVVGPDVVTAIEVRGPTAPDWNKGPLRVRGRGPGDTYG